eukprot:m51a1_g13081 putative dihydropyrimidinase (160) ;mRNA; f:1969-2709
MEEPSTLVIEGGCVATDEYCCEADVHISGRRVAQVVRAGQPRPPLAPSARVINARGKVVIPGGVDPHCHLEYPQGPHRIVSCDDWRTGTAAALCGGTTCVVDFAEARAGQTLAEAIRERRAAAESRSAVDFGLHAALTRAELVREVPEAVRAGCPSTTS